LQSKNWVDSIDASDQKLARPGAPHFSPRGYDSAALWIILGFNVKCKNLSAAHQNLIYYVYYIIFYFLLNFLLLLLKIVVAQAEPTNYEYQHYIKLNNGIYLNRCADIVIVSRLIQQRSNAAINKTTSQQNKKFVKYK